MFALWSTFDARDLKVIADFLSRSTELAVACCKDIGREATQPSSQRRSRDVEASHKRLWLLLPATALCVAKPEVQSDGIGTRSSEGLARSRIPLRRSWRSVAVGLVGPARIESCKQVERSLSKSSQDLRRLKRRFARWISSKDHVHMKTLIHNPAACHRRRKENCNA